jgi:hypothetical protein
MSGDLPLAAVNFANRLSPPISPVDEFAIPNDMRRLPSKPFTAVPGSVKRAKSKLIVSLADSGKEALNGSDAPPKPRFPSVEKAVEFPNKLKSSVTAEEDDVPKRPPKDDDDADSKPPKILPEPFPKPLKAPKLGPLSTALRLPSIPKPNVRDEGMLDEAGTVMPLRNPLVELALVELTGAGDDTLTAGAGVTGVTGVNDVGTKGKLVA